VLCASSGTSHRHCEAEGQSKLAEMLFALELDRRSRAAGWGIVSNTAHPGLTLSHYADVFARPALRRASAPTPSAVINAYSRLGSRAAQASAPNSRMGTAASQ